MTTQDLTENRNEIIAIITEKCGEENVKKVMKEMLSGLDCCDTLEELISESIYMALEFEVKIEKSNLAKMHCEAHLDEKYNFVTKQFNKI